MRSKFIHFQSPDVQNVMYTPAKESSSRCVISKHKSSAKKAARRNAIKLSSFKWCPLVVQKKIKLKDGCFKMHLFLVFSVRLRKPNHL